MCLFSALLANAQDTPAITLTADVDGNPREIAVSATAAGTKVTVDWGDGNLVTSDELAVEDGWTTTTLSGTPAGEGVIKIYGTGIARLEANSVYVTDDDGNKSIQVGITAADVTNAADLQYLVLNSNKLTSIDVSNNTALQKLDLSNNQLTSIDVTKNTQLTNLTLSNNQLTAIDLSNNPSIKTLYLSQNKFSGSLDLSAVTALKSAYLLDNELTDVNFGDNTTLSYISLNNNKISSIDVSKQTGLVKGSLFLINNEIADGKNIVLPEGAKTLNISKNKLTFATMPELTIAKNVTYAPQQDIELAKETNTIDLSAQATVGENATTFTVYTYNENAAEGEEAATALTADTDYKIANGVITFENIPELPVYVAMENASYDKFTGDNVLKTTVTKIVKETTGISAVQKNSIKSESFNLSGMKADKSFKGIIISNGKKYIAK